MKKYTIGIMILMAALTSCGNTGKNEPDANTLPANSYNTDSNNATNGPDNAPPAATDSSKVHPNKPIDSNSTIGNTKDMSQY